MPMISVYLSAVLALQPPTPTPSCRNLASAAPTIISRRSALLSLGTAAALVAPARPAAASELRDAEFAYRLTYPDDWSEAGKPVKTHLHEVLLSAPSGPAKMKLGVTVDPVKIDSLEAFGNLEQVCLHRRASQARPSQILTAFACSQVTSRVLGVEEGRDGVKSVKLRANAAEAADPAAGKPSYYTIEYATVNKRGDKLYCCKYCIANKRLYVLQAQASLTAFDDDESVRAGLRSIVGSFLVATS